MRKIIISCCVLALVSISNVLFAKNALNALDVLSKVINGSQSNLRYYIQDVINKYNSDNPKATWGLDVENIQVIYSLNHERYDTYYLITYEHYSKNNPLISETYFGQQLFLKNGKLYDDLSNVLIPYCPQERALATGGLFTNPETEYNKRDININWISRGDIYKDAHSEYACRRIKNPQDNIGKSIFSIFETNPHLIHD
jgi:hypothetical protein